MSGRTLNVLEAKIHQTALQAGKPLTQKELDALAPDAAARTSAINFLLGAGLLKLMKDAHNMLLYRAVQKGEMDIKKGLTGEENMVLGHIQVAANQGIWTKHLKAKTELHQTVIDRCLKSLVQKQLIKAVKGVDKNRTRKIYMMAHLEPSVELTGGPWYTDSELDTEFIKLLCSACLRFIRERSFPKSVSGLPPSEQPLYAIGAGPGYPTTAQITNFLTKSKITETQLSEEHVEMLLNVLVLDGEVEKIPAFAAALFDANDIPDGASDSGSESDSDDDKPKKKKRKASKEASKSKSKKRKRSEDIDDESDESDATSKKRRKRKRAAESDEDNRSEAESKKRKKKRKADDSDASEPDDEGDNGTKRRSKSKGRSKSKSKLRKRSRHASSDEDSASESESDSNSSSGSDSDSARHKRSRSRSKSKSSSKSSKSSKSKSKTKLRVRSSSPDVDAAVADSFSGGAWVYRAIRQERISLGWAQAPCGRCPVFDFCKDGGPTNPRGCEYFDEWLARGVAPLGLEDS